MKKEPGEGNKVSPFLVSGLAEERRRCVGGDGGEGAARAGGPAAAGRGRGAGPAREEETSGSGREVVSAKGGGVSRVERLLGLWGR